MQILQILSGLLKFWDQVTWLIKLLQGTPEEHHEKIVNAIQAEADKLKQTGRPTW